MIGPPTNSNNKGRGLDEHKQQNNDDKSPLDVNLSSIMAAEPRWLLVTNHFINKSLLDILDRIDSSDCFCTYCIDLSTNTSKTSLTSFLVNRQLAAENLNFN